VRLTEEQIARLLDALTVRDFADVLLVLAHPQPQPPPELIPLLRRQAG